jgi:hypothetical protein
MRTGESLWTKMIQLAITQTRNFPFKRLNLVANTTNVAACFNVQTQSVQALSTLAASVTTRPTTKLKEIPRRITNLKGKQSPMFAVSAARQSKRSHRLAKSAKWNSQPTFVKSALSMTRWATRKAFITVTSVASAEWVALKTSSTAMGAAAAYRYLCKQPISARTRKLTTTAQSVCQTCIRQETRQFSCVVVTQCIQIATKALSGKILRVLFVESRLSIRG